MERPLTKAPEGVDGAGRLAEEAATDASGSSAAWLQEEYRRLAAEVGALRGELQAARATIHGLQEGGRAAVGGPVVGEASPPLDAPPAVALLIRRQAGPAYNLAYRCLLSRERAERVARQALVHVALGSGELGPEPAVARGVLAAVAGHCLAELERRPGQGTDAASPDVWDDLASPDLLETPTQGGGLRVKVLQSLLLIPPEQRQALVGYQADGSSFVEIAAGLRRRAVAALVALPGDQRLALALRELHRFPYAEIAEALTSRPAVVQEMLLHARQGFWRACLVATGIQPEAGACARLLPRLVAFVDDELTLSQRRGLDLHLQRCAGCDVALRELQIASHLYGLVPAVIPPPALQRSALLAVSTQVEAPAPAPRPPGFGRQGARLLARLRVGPTTEPRARTERRGPTRLVVVGAAVGAILAAASVAASVALRPAAAPAAADRTAARTLLQPTAVVLTPRAQARAEVGTDVVAPSATQSIAAGVVVSQPTPPASPTARLPVAVASPQPAASPTAALSPSPAAASAGRPSPTETPAPTSTPVSPPPLGVGTRATLGDVPVVTFTPSVGLRVREGPATDAAVVRSVSAGTPLHLRGPAIATAEGNFYLVELADGTTGYVAPPPGDIPSVPSSTEAYRLRTGPTAAAPARALVRAGTSVLVLALPPAQDEGSWARVRLVHPTLGTIEGYLPLSALTPTGSG